MGCGGGPLAYQPVPVDEVQFDGPLESGVHFSGSLEQHSDLNLPLGKTRWDFRVYLQEKRETDHGNYSKSAHIRIDGPDQLVLSINGAIVDLYGMEVEVDCWFSPCYAYEGSVLTNTAPEGYDFKVVFHAARTASVDVHIKPPQFSISPVTENSSTDVTQPVMVSWDEDIVSRPALNVGTFALDLDSLLIDESPADRGIVADSPDCSRTISRPGFHSDGPMQGVYAAGFDCQGHNWSFFRLVYEDRLLYLSRAGVDDFQGFKAANVHVDQRSELVYWPFEGQSSELRAE